MAERATPNIYLNNRQRTRQFLARVITEIYNGKIEVNKGRTVIYGLNSLLAQFNFEEQEKMNAALVKLCKQHGIDIAGEPLDEREEEVNYIIEKG